MVGPPVALVGCTASGKSAVAIELARRDPAWEIVSADSMQVYRGMDVGTAKPSPSEQALVRHHLIDVADPWDDHDVATHQAAARVALAEIDGRGGRALVVGGTALYLRAMVDGLSLPGRFPAVRARLEAEADTAALHARLASLDPVAAARMEPNNRRRVVRALEVTLGGGRPFSAYGPGLSAHPPTPFALVGIRWDRALLDERIARRYRQQLAAGFLDEVRRLRAGPRPLSRTAAQALGYRELLAHLDGDLSMDDALALAVRRTCRFARRQERWFRRDPRISWVDGVEDVGALADSVQRAADGAAE